MVSVDQMLWEAEFVKLKSLMEGHFELQHGLLKDLSRQVQCALDPNERDRHHSLRSSDTLGQLPLQGFIGAPAKVHGPGSESDPTASDVVGPVVVGLHSDGSQEEAAPDGGPKKQLGRKTSLHSLDSTDTFVSDFLHRSEKKAQTAADRLTAQRYISENSGTGLFQESLVKSLAVRVVASPFFVYAVTTVIVFNLVILGIEVDASTTLGQNDIPGWFTVCNGFVVAFFTCELSINLYAQGCSGFFCGQERWWNLFDLIIIVLSLLETALDLWVALSNGDGNQTVSPSNVRFARIVRLGRALRGIRVMRLLRYVSALRTLVLSILSSMASLMWTLVLLMLLFYSFGVLFTQLVTDQCREEAIAKSHDINSIPECTNQNASLWRSIPESMLTLFMAITGGLDWENAMQPLMEISLLAGLCLVMYMTITYFAIVNVITGVFVTTAMETTSADKDLAVMKQLQRHNAQVEDLKSLFKEISGGEHNEVSISQFSTAMSIPKFKAFLQAMGISTEDVGVLFKLLDADASGLVELDEFVKGCLNLHGTAKSLQLARMSYENKLTRREIKQLRNSVGDLSTMLRLSTLRVEKESQDIAFDSLKV